MTRVHTAVQDRRTNNVVILTCSTDVKDFIAVAQEGGAGYKRASHTLLYELDGLFDEVDEVDEHTRKTMHIHMREMVGKILKQSIARDGGMSPNLLCAGLGGKEKTNSLPLEVKTRASTARFPTDSSQSSHSPPSLSDVKNTGGSSFLCAASAKPLRTMSDELDEVDDISI